jgi:hypothetical protein
MGIRAASTNSDVPGLRMSVRRRALIATMGIRASSTNGEMCGLRVSVCCRSLVATVGIGARTANGKMRVRVKHLCAYAIANR